MSFIKLTWVIKHHSSQPANATSSERNYDENLFLFLEKKCSDNRHIKSIFIKKQLAPKT